MNWGTMNTDAEHHISPVGRQHIKESFEETRRPHTELIISIRFISKFQSLLVTQMLHMTVSFQNKSCFINHDANYSNPYPHFTRKQYHIHVWVFSLLTFELTYTFSLNLPWASLCKRLCHFYVIMSLISNIPILQHMSQTYTSYCSSHYNHTCKQYNSFKTSV
jgi:hypothetical protein